MTSSPPRRSVIAAHPLATFFVLAFGLSWIAWVPFIIARNGLGLLPFTIPGGPAASQLIGVLPGAYLGPVTAAVVVTAVTEGRAGLRSWLGRLLRLRVGWRWPLGIILAVPATILGLTFALPSAWTAVRPVPLVALVAYLPMLAVQMVTTALAEEPGWRDFALPRLQGRWGAVGGTVALGALWGCWHLPLFLTTWAGPDPAWWSAPVFVASSVPLSLVMTWVFNRTGQSVPMVMLLHAGVNATFSLLWPAMFPGLDLESTTILVQMIATTAVALVLVGITRGRLGLDELPGSPDGRYPSRPVPPAVSPEPGEGHEGAAPGDEAPLLPAGIRGGARRVSRS